MGERTSAWSVHWTVYARPCCWWGYLLALLCWLPASAVAQKWQGFYDRPTLEHWRTQFPAGIEENLREVLLPKLTEAERTALGPVRLLFPLERAAHPMNVTSHLASRTVNMPVSSLRFLGDICLAYAWLNANGYSLDTVSEYLAMLNHNYPAGFEGQARRPLEVLRIPANARDDARVARDMQRLFSTAVVFILAHELGHLRHGHVAGEADLAKAREQEAKADEFALDLMQRLGEVPVGAVPFFLAYSHLGSLESDADMAAHSLRETHPTSAQRLRSITARLRAGSREFSRTADQSAAVAKTAAEIDTIAAMIGDAGVQDLLRQKGLAARVAALGPRRVGALPSNPQDAGGSGAFAGTWRGAWVQSKGQVELPVKLSLNQQGDQVRGSYSFGASMVTLEGQVNGGQLHYRWRWGTEHFGKGVLAAGAGQRLVGTWGYTQADAGAGTWRLEREP